MALLTVAERSGYRATCTHAELMGYLAELEGLHTPLLHVGAFGESPQGRTLPLLVLSSEGVHTPAEARALGRPVVLLQNGIHAGEVEGKESALMLVRDLLAGRHPGLLEALTVIVVPLFNPDGNDAMDPGNRALRLQELTGQSGPPSVGTRVNAGGINLNRDYMRHDAQEMRLLQTRVCQPWEPELTVDTHATNGSVHRFAMTVDIPHTQESGRHEPIDFMRRVLVPEVVGAVRRDHGLDSGWYGNFVEDERALAEAGVADPSGAVSEGWITYPHHPRFGSNYRGLGGRLDLLLECYSYLDFEARVRTTYAWLVETLRAAAGRAGELLDLIAATRTPPDRIAVRYRIDAADAPVEVLTRRPRTLTGEPTSVTLPYLGRFRGTVTVSRPRAYLVPGRLEAFLRGHGLRVAPAPRRPVEMERLRFEGASHEAGRSILEADGVGLRRVSVHPTTTVPPEGWLELPTDQPLGALAVYLCEPESDDGLVENGLLPTPPEGGDFEVVRVR